jgi:hypothetical protein
VRYLKFIYIFLIIIALFGSLEIYKKIEHSDVQVIDYSTLKLKIEYGTEPITIDELQIGFYAEVQAFCSMPSMGNLQNSIYCNSKLNKHYLECTNKSIEYIDLASISLNRLHDYVREFKVCTKN